MHFSFQNTKWQEFCVVSMFQKYFHRKLRQNRGHQSERGDGGVGADGRTAFVRRQVT
jgi:hypothetical protein